MTAYYGKAQGGVVFIQRAALLQFPNLFDGTAFGGPAFTNGTYTLVSTVGNTITVSDTSSQQWVSRYNVPVGACPEWVPFDKVS
jgi:hypothetical protein